MNWNRIQDNRKQVARPAGHEAEQQVGERQTMATDSWFANNTYAV